MDTNVKLDFFDWGWEFLDRIYELIIELPGFMSQGINSSLEEDNSFSEFCFHCIVYVLCLKIGVEMLLNHASLELKDDTKFYNTSG